MSRFRYSALWPNLNATIFRPARIDGNGSGPPIPHPKMLLFRYALPPLDSMTEMLGSKRQSKWLSSAACTKSSAIFEIGQCKEDKKVVSRSVRGSTELGRIGGSAMVRRVGPGMGSTSAEAA